LAALKTHDQKNGLQSSDRRGICKNLEKMVQAGLGSGARLFWEVLVQFPAMGRGKPIENGQTGVRESFLGTTPA